MNSDHPDKATSPADLCRRCDRAGSAFYLVLQSPTGDPEIHDILGYDYEWVRTCKADSGDPTVWRRWAEITPVQIVDDHPDF